MTDNIVVAEAGATVRELMMQFPLPLALIGSNGRTEMVNTQFAQLFDPALLDTEVFQAVARHPGRPWQRTQVTRRDGLTIAAQIQAISLHGHVMLVIDEAPAPDTAGELDQLHARIAELERLSATDHLTGAWNRAHLDRVIEAEISRSQHFRQPLSLILFDIDHFKHINDTYGHQAGDAVLRELVLLIRNRIRASDLLFRWGGEEFVVLTTAVGYRNAEVLAETLRRAVAQHPFPAVGDDLRVSLGVAEYCNGEDAQTWFHRLDEALYAAKESGRDRVVVDRRGNSDRWAEETGMSALRLTWHEGYECGEPTIDSEHRELFALANELIDASFSRGDDPQLFDTALTRLLEHIKRHFADEEALLEQHGYVHLAGHRRAHAHLLKQALELKTAVEQGQFSLGKLVDLLATEIVARHLFTADRDFFSLFRKDRVTPT